MKQSIYWKSQARYCDPPQHIIAGVAWKENRRGEGGKGVSVEPHPRKRGLQKF